MIFIVILILATLSFNAIFYLYSQQQTDAAAIDAAGRNLMLSQRIGFLAEQIVRGNEDAKTDLSEIIGLYDNSFYALKNGGIAPEIADNRPLRPAPESMAPLFAESHQLWLGYKLNAETIVKQQTMNEGTLNPTVSAAISAIESNASDLLQKNDDIVKEYVSLNYSRQVRFGLFIMWILLINMLAILLAFILSRSISKPIEELRSATEKVQKGQFSTRVSIMTGDEIERLGEAFNRTTEALERIDEEHRQVEKTKTRFLSITSHELRSPLTAMKAQLQMMEKGYFGKLNAKQKEASEIVLRNTDRLDNILLDFLDISRMEAARLKFEFQKTSLESHIRRLVREVEGFLPDKGIRIELHIGKLPVMEVDPDRVMQVLRNLLNNAKKFSPVKSTITVSVKQEDNHILFSVTDQGIGMSAEDQKHLFEPFFQAEKTLNRKYGGTGLGLALCRGIIKCQKGRIWAESEPGRGSTFYFTVPMTPVKETRPIKVIFGENGNNNIK